MSLAISASWSSAAKTARCVRMEQRVQRDPLDADAWVVLLGEACMPSRRQISDRSSSAASSTSPPQPASGTSGSRLSCAAATSAAMEALFERCLLTCPHVELWRLYLRYQRGEKRCEAKELQQTYELLLEAVGADVTSGKLWAEHVDMLKEAVEPGMMPMSGPVQACREGFQRCLLQPAVGLVALWKEYEQWETLQSGPQAKQILADIADRALVGSAWPRSARCWWNR